MTDVVKPRAALPRLVSRNSEKVLQLSVFVMQSEVIQGAERPADILDEMASGLHGKASDTRSPWYAYVLFFWGMALFVSHDAFLWTGWPTRFPRPSRSRTRG